MQGRPLCGPQARGARSIVSGGRFAHGQEVFCRVVGFLLGFPLPLSSFGAAAGSRDRQPPGSRQRHPCLTQALGRSTLPRSTTRACRCRGRHGVLRGAAAVGSAWGCGAPARRRRAPLEEGERRQGLPPRAERRAREGAAGTRGTGLGGRARAREGNGHAGGEPPLGPPSGELGSTPHHVPIVLLYNILTG